MATNRKRERDIFPSMHFKIITCIEAHFGVSRDRNTIRYWVCCLYPYAPYVFPLARPSQRAGSLSTGLRGMPFDVGVRAAYSPPPHPWLQGLSLLSVSYVFPSRNALCACVCVCVYDVGFVWSENRFTGSREFCPWTLLNRWVLLRDIEYSQSRQVHSILHN